MKKYLALIISIVLANGAFAQDLYTLPGNFKSSSISSFENMNGTKGAGGKTNHSAKGNAFEDLKSGQSKTLLDIEGSGIIQRMWFTVRDRSPKMMRSIAIADLLGWRIQTSRGCSIRRFFWLWPV